MKRMCEIKKPTELWMDISVACVCVCVYVSACLSVVARRSVGRYLCLVHIYFKRQSKNEIDFCIEILEIVSWP